MKLNKYKLRIVIFFSVYFKLILSIHSNDFNLKFKHFEVSIYKQTFKEITRKQKKNFAYFLFLAKKQSSSLDLLKKDPIMLPSLDICKSNSNKKFRNYHKSLIVTFLRKILKNFMYIFQKS